MIGDAEPAVAGLNGLSLRAEFRHPGRREWFLAGLTVAAMIAFTALTELALRFPIRAPWITWTGIGLATAGILGAAWLASGNRLDPPFRASMAALPRRQRWELMLNLAQYRDPHPELAPHALEWLSRVYRDPGMPGAYLWLSGWLLLLTGDAGPLWLLLSGSILLAALGSLLLRSRLQRMAARLVARQPD